MVKKIIAGILLFLFGGCHQTAENIHGLFADNAMVVTAHPLASKTGTEIMMEGGNAVDAAVAVQFILAVVYPIAGNIGGGGFLVLRLENGESITLDFREKAPLAASRKMYLDASGNVIDNLSTQTLLSCGVPGTVDGMVTIHQKYGSRSWEELIQPAIELAENGFPITRQQADNLNHYQEYFRKANTIVPGHMIRPNWQIGDTLVQKDLAETLKRIRDQGREGFYNYKTAELILDEMSRGKGIIAEEDLKQYRSVWREALQGKYKNYDIISMGPPSSGGIALIQLLQMVEPYPLKEWGWNSVNYLHLLIEAEKRVYADRSKYLGDNDFYPVPVKQLTDPGYNSQKLANFSLSYATPSDSIHAGDISMSEKNETTHFSIVDRDGNAVAVTTTLNGAYGSKIMVNGAGFFMNNEMDDFSIKPGYPNMFGLTGGEANAIYPEKRMLSSMTPAIILRNGDLYMVLGSPGGSTIITSVFQTILNVVDFEMTMQEAVIMQRFHNQWKPEETKYESGRIRKRTLRELIDMGHQFREVESIGRVDAIRVLSNGLLEGGADPRGDDIAAGF